MNLKLDSPWPEVKEKLKEVSHSLTDDDLDYIPGHEEELLRKVSLKLGMTIPGAKAWIESVSFNEGIAS